jgi:hypothetical protein
LLLYGLLTSASYFGGEVRADYEEARNAVNWRKWLDYSTPGHRNQFHMAYRPGTGFFAWWDWYTQEAMLICVLASMSESCLEPANVWRGWRREVQTYTSAPPECRTFTFCAPYFGDPFTLVYGLAFLDFARFPEDLDGWNWFGQGRAGYQASVEFFKKERGYLDGLTAGYSVCAPNGVMARPNGPRLEPLRRTDGTVYTTAGGLAYFGDSAATNLLAATLARLLRESPAFLGWHGWPAPNVDALAPAHRGLCDRIVGQDIVFTGLAIDNYFTHRAQDLVLQDPAMRRTLNAIFPLQGSLVPGSAPGCQALRCTGVPFTVFRIEQTSSLTAAWSTAASGTLSPRGECELTVPVSQGQQFYRLMAE